MRSIRTFVATPIFRSILFVLSISVAATFGLTQLASAVVKQSDMTLEEANKSSSYYITLEGCMQNMQSTIEASSSDISPTVARWFDNNDAYGYVYPVGKQDCKDIMKNALDLWGISPDDFLAGIKYTKAGGNSYNWNGTSNNATRKANFDSYIKVQLGVSDPGNPGAAAAYLRYSYWWDNECVVKKFGQYDAISDPVLKSRVDNSYTEQTNVSVIGGGQGPATTSYLTVMYAKVLRSDGKQWAYSYKYSNDTSNITSTSSPYDFIAYGFHTNPRTVNCKDVATSLAKYADDYATYLNNQAVEDICTTRGYTNTSSSGTNPFGTHTLNACIAGYNSKTTDPLYCANTYKPETITYYGQKITSDHAAELEACKVGLGITDADLANARNGIVAQNKDNLSANNEAAAQSCGDSVEGVGWILCPVLNAMAGLNDAMWGFVSLLLTVSPLQQVDIHNNQTATYAVWSTFRSLANVLLTVVFLIMIFSQLTGAGISNYGIKKTLPRLIVAAIAINTSFFIMQIAVDAFNLIGKGVYDILDSLIPVSAPDPSTGWTALIGLILTSSAAVGVGALVFTMAPQFALMLLIPVALAGLLGLLAALVTLLLRQALIPILAVVAPIMFIAYLLPNTKSWFDKWKNLFITMLMLFPIAALLFAGVKLASSMFTSNGQWWGVMVGLAILTVPLFMLPFIARQSGPMLTKAYNGIRKSGNVIEKPVGAFADRRKKLSLARSDATSASKFNLIKRARQGLNRSRSRVELFTKAADAQGEADFNTKLAAKADTWAEGKGVASIGSAAQAYVRGAGVRAETEELKQAQGPLQQEVAKVRAEGGNTDDFMEKRAVDMSRSVAERNAALHELAGTGRDSSIRRLASNPNVDQEALQKAITSNFGSLVTKAPDLVKMPEAAFNNVKGAEMANYTSGTAAVQMDYIKTQFTRSSDTTLKPAERDKARENLAQAVAAFNSATEDITKNPTLQAAFGGDVGKSMQKTIADASSANPAFAAFASSNMHGLIAIQSDGKIR